MDSDLANRFLDPLAASPNSSSVKHARVVTYLCVFYQTLILVCRNTAHRDKSHELSSHICTDRAFAIMRWVYYAWTCSCITMGCFLYRLVWTVRYVSVNAQNDCARRSTVGIPKVAFIIFVIVLG